jgi:phosphatidylinositol glycan class M
MISMHDLDWGLGKGKPATPDRRANSLLPPMSWTQHISFTRVLGVSALVRIALIVYAEWHDAHSVVKYTDVDYRVFGDATRFILDPAGGVAQGPLGSLIGVGE